MPLPDELEAIPRKIKPIFFMVELTEDEIHSKDTLEFVRRIVDRIYSVAIKCADFELYLGLYPYGVMCNQEPCFFRDCESVDWEMLRGDKTTELGTVIEKLNADLSSKARLKFSMGCYFPSIYLVNEHGVDASVEEQFSELAQNRWFHASKRWIIHSSEISDWEHTHGFVDIFEHIAELSLDKNIDLFIGNLLYSTCLMGEIGPGAMYAGMSITGSLMDIPLSAEELASFQTANFEIPQGFWDELSPTTQEKLCAEPNAGDVDSESDCIEEQPNPAPQNESGTNM